MKVSEALQTRKAMVQGMASLARRAQNDALLYKGDAKESYSDPNQSIRDLVSGRESLASLVTRINSANQSITLPNGMTVAQAITERDTRIKLVALLSGVSPTGRAEGTVLLLDMIFLRKVANQIAREARELDQLIQASNYTTDLP